MILEGYFGLVCSTKFYPKTSHPKPIHDLVSIFFLNILKRIWCVCKCTEDELPIVIRHHFNIFHKVSFNINSVTLSGFKLQIYFLFEFRARKLILNAVNFNPHEMMHWVSRIRLKTRNGWTLKFKQTKQDEMKDECKILMIKCNEADSENFIYARQCSKQWDLIVK